jgi:bacteriocin-like protein
MRSFSNFATMSASEMQQIEGGTYATICAPKPPVCAPAPKPVAVKPVVVKPPVVVVCPQPIVVKPVVVYSSKSKDENENHGKSKGYESKSKKC